MGDGDKGERESGLTLGDSRIAKREGRAIIAALFSVLLASCSSTTDPNVQLGTPGYNSSVTAGQASTASLGDDPAETSASTDAQTTAATVMDEDDAELPAEVAYLPAAKPMSESLAVQAQTAETSGQEQQSAAADQAATTAETAAAASPDAKSDAAQAQTQATKSQQVASAATEMNNPVYVTAGDPPSEKPAAPKKKGFLSSLFGASSAEAKPASAPVKSTPVATASEAEPKEEAKPIIQLASAKSDDKPVVLASLGGDDNALPGVRQTALFEIKRKSGMDDDSDVDLHEEDFGAVQVASAAGLARLAPNGLLTQTNDVDVACLKPSLVRVLKVVEHHYGKKAVITSGYRNQARNRRARGAKNSLHMYCAAADVQVPGVSKWELANFVRSMPGRGGVGTYCHTESVHIDVGPERDWNWRCRRRK